MGGFALRYSRASRSQRVVEVRAVGASGRRALRALPSLSGLPVRPSERWRPSFALFSARPAVARLLWTVRESLPFFGLGRGCRVGGLLSLFLVAFACRCQHARRGYDKAAGEKMSPFHLCSFLFLWANIAESVGFPSSFRRMAVICRQNGFFPLRGGERRSRIPKGAASSCM